MDKLKDLSLSQSWQWFRRTSRILWVRVALISLLSVVAALSATLLDPLIPEVSKDRFGPQATLPVLNVLASSMLAVATFSLGIMVSSHRTLADQASPRIHQLLIRDTSTQTVLATFIGAFVYALSAIILFRAEYYDQNASVVVFGTTVLVVMIIVVSLVRWIERLSEISSLDYALDRAEGAAEEVLKVWADRPNQGCKPRDGQGPDPAGQGGADVCADSSGYVLRLQLEDLQGLAEDHDCEVCILIRPGDHVLEGDTLARVLGTNKVDAFRDCIPLDKTRSYEQDPRYALQALREGAQKALSPGINDPGTALSIIDRLHRLLRKAVQKRIASHDTDPVFDRLYTEDVSAPILIDEALRGVIRDGRAFVDVLVATRRVTDDLAQVLPEDEALLAELAAFMDECASDCLTLACDRKSYRQARGRGAP